MVGSPGEAGTPTPPPLLLPQATRKPPASAIKKHSKEFFAVRRVFPVFIPVFLFCCCVTIRPCDRTAAGKENIPLFPVYANTDRPFSRALYLHKPPNQRQLPFPLNRNLSHSRHRCQSIIKIISRDDVFAACKENLLRRIRAVFSPRCRGFFRFLALPRLARARRFLVDFLARGFGGAHARAAFACRRRSIPQEWAATENPAAALLPSDSLVAHPPARRAATADLTALAQGRSVDTKKLRFVEKSLFDSQ